jgi:hypothetical protein
VIFAVAARAQTADEIIHRAVNRDITDFEQRKNYTFQERAEEREYDGKGKLKSKKSETHEILVLSGRPYEKLIARDDKPLSEKEARKEQEKLDREAKRRSEQSSGEAARLEKERRDARKYLDEFSEAFSFQLLGDDTVSGKPTWVIQAEPKRGYQAKDMRAKIFSKVHGKIWIDKGEFHWVKAEGEAMDTISYGLFLLRVAPGGRLSFEQTRVNDEVWLPSRINLRGEGRLALVKKVRAEVDVTYREYHKFQAESHIVADSSSSPPR